VCTLGRIERSWLALRADRPLAEADPFAAAQPGRPPHLAILAVPGRCCAAEGRL